MNGLMNNPLPSNPAYCKAIVRFRLEFPLIVRATPDKSREYHRMKKTAIVIQNSTDAHHRSLDLTRMNTMMERKNAKKAKNRVTTMNGFSDHQDAPAPNPLPAYSAKRDPKQKENA